MPTCNVYLSADEYASLVYEAAAQKTRPSIGKTPLTSKQCKDLERKLGYRIYGHKLHIFSPITILKPFWDREVDTILLKEVKKVRERENV